MKISDRVQAIVRSIDELSRELSSLACDTNLVVAVHGLYSSAVAVVGDERAVMLLASISSQDTARDIRSTGDLLQRIAAIKSQIDMVIAMKTVSRVERHLSGAVVNETLDVSSELRSALNMLSDHSGCSVDSYRMRRESVRDLSPEEMKYSMDFATGTVFDSWSILGAGELGVILAPPAVGKTTALVHIGAQMAMKSIGVVHHFSLEMGMLSIVGKYTRSIDYDDQKINVYYAPPASMTVQRIRQIVESESATTGDTPAVVIVDHISHLGNPTGGNAMSKYDKMSENVLLLKGLAHDLKCPVWTASQPQRGSTRDMRSVSSSNSGGYVLGMQDVAECWAIPQVADTLISLNQTDAERECTPPKCRAHAAKIRNPKPDQMRMHTVQTCVDYARCSFLPEYQLV